MKKFTFPMDRVVDWRRTQAHIEEAKLQALFTEIHSLDARQAQLHEQRAESEQALLAEPAATGLELAALDAFRRFTVTEHVRLEAQRAGFRRQIAAQVQVIACKRRDLRLLERLRERRLKVWETEFGKEIDAQAGEAYLAKWKPASGRNRT